VWAIVEKVVQKLPTIKKPKYLTNLDRLKWSAIAVILYLLLSYTPLIGVSQTGAGVFEELVVLLGASFGSIVSLGIGPIIIGYLLAELFIGSGELNIDITTEEGKRKFENLARFFMIVFGLFESIVMATIGWFKPSQFLISLFAMPFSFLGSNAFLIGYILAVLFIVAQLMLGVILAYLLDDLSQKWGFTSGINLFILATVSRELFVQLFNPLTQIPGTPTPPIGKIPQIFYFISQGLYTEAIVVGLQLLVIVLVILLSVYFYMVKIPIPTSFGKIPEKSLRYEVRLIYTGNIPVIFAFAFLHQILLIAWVLQQLGIPLLGTIENGHPINGLVAYIYPDTGFLISLILGNLTLDNLIRTITSSLFFLGSSILFSIYFVLATGQDSEGLAKQLSKMFGRIGLKRDYRIIKHYLDKIIPCVTVLGGFIVGFLALLSYWVSIPIGGTSILLATMISYMVYEQLKETGILKELTQIISKLE